MNRSQEATAKSGKAASHYQPLLGMYDSKDPYVIECHILWMKAAGFDGVLADWYGTQNHFDYPVIHERTEALFNQAEQAGLKIGVVYEDQTVKNAINNNLITKEAAQPIAKTTGEWLKSNWLKRPSWLRFNKNPAVLVFGPQHFEEADWNEFRSGAGDIDLITLNHPKPYAQGTFDWPVPDKGNAFQKTFLERSKGSQFIVSAAYPRFHDYYEAGGQKGYPLLADNSGQTYKETLRTALSQKPNAIQTATWNDWQEGTQIEPSKEFGFRDLIATQQVRKQMDSSFPFKASDFELPLRIYELRRKGGKQQELDEAAKLFLTGKTSEAKVVLDEINKV